jgi:EAL domain-containing protein (putative c-di-GMP-specific phosphodiesterase class I)
MYRAKQNGKNGISFYQPHFQTEFNLRFLIQNELNRHLESTSFRLFYQPLYCAKKNTLLGFEALIRWPNTDPIYTPDEFIPIAEQSKLINPIGQWVIKTAICQLSKWHQQFDPQLTMSINISPVQLQDADLLAELTQATTEYLVSPGKIVLEITETALIKDNIKVTDTLCLLSQKGYKIALDDFGMGFSSVAHLMDYPIDIVKLDKSMQTTSKRSDKRIRVFEALALMLKKLEFIVVAEGVETEQQLRLCQEFDLDRLQGYLLGIPMDDAKSESLLQGIYHI